MNSIYPRERFLSEIGSQLTQGLFYEYRHQTTTKASPPYTLREIEWKGCISMYQIYMKEESEYEAALILLGSWSHWTRLCKCSWFKPYVTAWREEREIREAALGKKTLIEKAAEGNVSAAKELVHQVTKAKKRGRPSKNDIEAREAKEKRIDQRVVSLLERAPSGF